MKIPYLGKVRMHWCDSCNVPLIRSHCSICEKNRRKVNITPPGDIRPAFEGDLKRIISLVEKQFGNEPANIMEEILHDQVFLLNKVPYIDRMDEILLHGEVIALLRFNPLKEDFEILPKLSLARTIWHRNSSSWVDVDIGAREPIQKGASVLVPGILSVHGKIVIDDPIIVTCQQEVIAVGLAKMDHETMKNSERGVAIKTKYRKILPKNIIEKGKITTWQNIVQANKNSLSAIENEAIGFIEKVAVQYKHTAVAYSGGKDSLVTLDLVAKSDVPYDIIFADTGLEFPETLENIDLIAERYNRRILTNENQSWNFWERFEQFGPPTRNSRWCCKSSKLAPVNNILESRYPDNDKILTYLGKRRFESYGRSQEPRLSQNPWIPKQISASPINDWSAFEVFLYIESHNLKTLLNPLYTQGFIRIGCWLCPASSLADLSMLEKSHPALFKMLNKRLSKIKSYQELPKEYLTWGLWRWKILPSKVSVLLKQKNISYKPKDISQEDLKLFFHLTSSPSPCVIGGFSSYLSANQMLNLELIENLIPILGKIQYDEDLDILSLIDDEESQSDVFRDGSIIVRAKELAFVDKKSRNIVKTIFRVTHCDGCGVCTYNCPTNALKVTEGVIQVNPDTCTHCLKCNNFCPLLKYREDSTFLGETIG
jgi:phosphoadenosine phosphosulfate reductase